MIIYTSLIIINLISILIFKSLEARKGKDFSSYYLLVFFVTTFVISGLRAQSVGTDTYNYQSIFQTIGLMGTEYYDFSKFPGYTLYNLFIYRVNNNPQIITIFNSLVISLGMSICFKRLSTNPYMSSLLYITLYHYFVTMNATRQYISVIFLFISIYYFINKKKRFLLYFTLALSFHQVSIIGVLYFILYKIKWNTKRYIWLGISTILSGVFFSRFTIIFSKIFPDYNMYFNQNSAVNLASTGNGNKVILSLFLMIFILMGVYVVKKNVDKNDSYYRFLLACVLISLILDIIFNKNIMMIRVVLYFNIMYLFFIPLTISYFSCFIKEKYMFNIITSVGTLLITLIPFYYQLSNNMVNVLPYLFFWNF